VWVDLVFVVQGLEVTVKVERIVLAVGGCAFQEVPIFFCISCKVDRVKNVLRCP